MPSPRNQYRWDEADPKSLQAFPVDLANIPYEATPARNSAWVDKVVKLTSAGLVQKCADGDEILGVLEQITEDGRSRVQIGGLRVLPCGSGVTFTLNQRVVADASGGVKPATGSAGSGRALFKPTATTVLVQLY